MRAAELFNLNGETALVTGGASGLGRHFAGVLADAGARVFIADIHRENLAATLEAFAASGRDISGIQTDLCDEAALVDLFDAIEAAGGPAAIVVNNAGVVHRDKASRMKREDFRRIVDVNVEAAFRVAQEAARRLIAARRPGSIINVSSILAEVPFRQIVAYGASKAALSQMTRALALEWGRQGIRVNEIRPGWFDTGLSKPFLEGPGGAVLSGRNPLGRLGQLEDLDGAILYLASRASAFVTGTAITIDGGQSLES